MSLERESREALQARPQAPRACGWRKPNLEQAKRTVYKKVVKPLMEKKRRDRIAHSLNQLKALLVDVPNQGNKSLHTSRMDKAALLEMTVKWIQTLQLAVAEDRSFRTGSSYCASFVQATVSERQRYLEAPSQSRPNYETFSLVTSPPTPGLEKISSWNEKQKACPRSPCSRRLVPSAVLSRTGSQVFWRPWST